MTIVPKIDVRNTEAKWNIDHLDLRFVINLSRKVHSSFDHALVHALSLLPEGNQTLVDYTSYTYSEQVVGGFGYSFLMDPLVNVQGLTRQMGDYAMDRPEEPPVVNVVENSSYAKLVRQARANGDANKVLSLTKQL